MRAGRRLVLLWTLLLVGGGEAWAGSDAKVGLVPITSTGKKARRVAKKLTRKLIKTLRRGRRKRAVKVIRRRAAARLRRCLQDKACRLRESHKIGVDYWLIGHVVEIDRRFHIDLQIIAKDVGVVGSRSVDGSAGKLIRSSVRGARRLVAKAAQKAKALAAKRREERQRKAAVDKQVQRMDKADEPPTAAALAPPPTKGAGEDDRGFFSSVFAWRYWMGWTAAGLAVASLGGAIAFGVVSSSSVSDAENPDITQVDAWKLRDEAQRNATMANVFFGVSGALAIASGVLIYLEFRKERAERGRAQPALAPAPAKTSLRLIPGPGSISLVGTF